MTRDYMLSWLANISCNSFTLSLNDLTAPNYQTFEEHYKYHGNEWCSDCSSDEIEEMKNTNKFWTLQIYVHTPIGFYHFSGPTLESVLTKAIDCWHGDKVWRDMS